MRISRDRTKRVTKKLLLDKWKKKRGKMWKIGIMTEVTLNHTLDLKRTRQGLKHESTRRYRKRNF